MNEYLAIKNWEKYQPRNKKCHPWIRDYKDKEFDPEFSRLTILQRYMLDACCRLRGRHNRNLTNDPLWICRATAVLPRERHNATTAIQQLISYGFLIPTNQQDTVQIPVRREEKRGVEESEVDKKQCARKARSIESSVFIKAYDRYPRHIGRAGALKAWNKAVARRKKGSTVEQTEDFLFNRVMTYGAACTRLQKDPNFLPHMSRWLNDERYLDDPSEWDLKPNGKAVTPPPAPVTSNAAADAELARQLRPRGQA